MFACEQEVRIVLSAEDDAEADPEQEIRGKGLDWTPERNVESIRVHPEADTAFMETVKAVVEQYARVERLRRVVGHERGTAVLAY